jgi:hypothetical protein
MQEFLALSDAREENPVLDRLADAILQPSVMCCSTPSTVMIVRCAERNGISAVDFLRCAHCDQHRSLTVRDSMLDGWHGIRRDRKFGQVVRREWAKDDVRSRRSARETDGLRQKTKGNAIMLTRLARRPARQ